MTAIRRLWNRLYFRMRHFLRLANRRLSPVEAILERRVLDTAPVVDLALPVPRRDYRVLLPVANPDSARRLARFAAAVARARKGEVVVLYIERPLGDDQEAQRQKPRQTAPSDSGAASAKGDRWAAVKNALDTIHEMGVPAGYVVRKATNVGRGIRREARRQDAELIVVGWRGAPCAAEPDPLEAGQEQAAQEAGRNAEIASIGDGANVTARKAENDAAREEQGSAISSKVPEEGSAREEATVLDATLDAVLEHPPCDVMVVGGRGDRLPRRLLVPFVTGNDTPIALRLAQELTEHGGSVTALRVLPSEATMAELDAEGRRFGDMLLRYGAAGVSQLEVRAERRSSGIMRAIERGYDGVVMAAPSETIIDHLLFGSTQMQVASECGVPVLVVKGRSGPLTYFARRLWAGVYDRLPKLTDEERESVSAGIEASAAPHADFFVMIALSSAIAAFGMLLSSPAIVIGAMLVAPLMSAVVGLGLGVVEGRPDLVKRAASAALRGALLALAVSVAIGMLQIQRIPGPEIVSRSRPTLFDLGVALASGAAGAYAVSRKGVQTALAGVAIAAALVPPLAAAGIGIALLKPQIALGALLLYFTNLVAIAAAGGVVFLLLGFGPSEEEEEGRLLLERGFRTAGGLLLVVVGALGFITWQTYELYSAERLQSQVEIAVRSELEIIPGADLVSVASVQEDEVLQVSPVVRLPSTMVSGIDYTVAQRIQDGLAERLERTVELDLSLVPVVQLQPKPPPEATPTGEDSPTDEAAP